MSYYPRVCATHILFLFCTYRRGAICITYMYSYSHAIPHTHTTQSSHMRPDLALICICLVQNRTTYARRAMASNKISLARVAYYIWRVSAINRALMHRHVQFISPYNAAKLCTRHSRARKQDDAYTFWRGIPFAPPATRPISCLQVSV